MKILAAADIHGSRYHCEVLADAFAREGADKLLLLGDILSPGDSEDSAAVLNGLSRYIVCLRGNCDWAVNQERLDFPCMDEYTLLRLGSALIFATHGHHFNEQRLPPIPFDILLHGHSHVPAWREHGEYIYLNPGSAARPRGGSENGYLLLENKGEENHFIWKDLEGKTLMTHCRPC